MISPNMPMCHNIMGPKKNPSRFLFFFFLFYENPSRFFPCIHVKGRILANVLLRKVMDGMENFPSQGQTAFFIYL